MKRTAQQRRAGRLLLARRALRGYEELPTTAEKIELLLAAADVLPPQEATAARSTAWSLQMVERQQLAFAELINRTGT